MTFEVVCCETGWRSRPLRTRDEAERMLARIAAGAEADRRCCQHHHAITETDDDRRKET